MKKEFLNYLKVYWKAAAVFLSAIALNAVFLVMASGARNDFLNKNMELSSLSSKKVNLLQLKREAEDLKTYEDRIKSSFLTNDNAVDFIIFVENLARSTGNGVSIKSVSEENADRYKSFRIELAGSYANLVNFIAQLENSPYLAYAYRVDIRKVINTETKSAGLRTVLDIKALSL
ncbi:MAG: hypothetical protein AAB861_03245 [Patescibacteria group bacterium]